VRRERRRREWTGLDLCPPSQRISVSRVFLGFEFGREGNQCREWERERRERKRFLDFEEERWRKSGAKTNYKFTNEMGRDSRENPPIKNVPS
jgi:hypothetical protein